MESISDGNLHPLVDKTIVAVHVVEPAAPHTATVIFLHGSGDQGFTFLSYAEELRDKEDTGLAHIKWILPSSRKRPSKANSFVIPRWFDDQVFRDKSTAPLDEITADIAVSVLSIHCLIREEIQRGIPPERIVLAGLSQGGGMALWAGLTFPEGRLGGICALASRLPAKKLVQTQLSHQAKEIPVFLGHGMDDRVVPLVVGTMKTAEFLEDVVGMKGETESRLCLKVYPDLAHWIGTAEWQDVGSWLGCILP